MKYSRPWSHSGVPSIEADEGFFGQAECTQLLEKRTPSDPDVA